MDENEIGDAGETVDESASPAIDRGAGVPWGGILLLIWAVALIIFSVQNAERTTVEFLGWQWEMPIALLVMVTALATLVLTGLGAAIYRRKRRARRQLAKGPVSDG